MLEAGSRLALVRQAEAELHRPERPVDVLHELRDRGLVLPDRPVRTVEHVEHVRQNVERSAIANVDLLLDPQVGTVLRGRDERIARNDRAVRTDSLLVARAAESDRVAAEDDRIADAGAEVMQAAQLEPLIDLPDAVQHQTMALIVGG